MSFCSPFAPHSPVQLLPSAAVAERSPCTAQRRRCPSQPRPSEAGALFHNALTGRLQLFPPGFPATNLFLQRRLLCCVWWEDRGVPTRRTVRKIGRASCRERV